MNTNKKIITAWKLVNILDFNFIVSINFTFFSK